MSADGSGMDKRLAALTPAQRALLEQRLMERRTQAAARTRIVRRTAPDQPAPLSYAQELLWLLSQVFDDGVAYNAPGAFQLEGPLDLDLLAHALKALTERHEVLRTVYEVIDGHPMQIVQSAQDIDLHLVDLRAMPADEREAEAQRILARESRFRFDLVSGPVMRVVVIGLAPDRHILMINMHHVATDGYSRTAIYRDLTELYEAGAEGRPPVLPELPIQYADYAVWQRGWLDGGIADAQLEYWKTKLAGAPSRLDLPTDFPRPPIRSYVGDNLSLMLDLGVREGLRGVARGADATLFVSLLATFATLLSRYSGQDDVVIGTPFAGRNRTELESMVGYFINPLALRLDLSGDPTFTELLSRARSTTLEAFAHADVPYETVVRATNPERDLSQTPVFQAMVVFHNPGWQTKRPKFEPAGIRATEISHEKGWSKFDVLLGMSERTTGLNTTWEYSTELFKPATVTRMMEHFRALATSAAEHPDRRLSRLPMLSEAERARVLVGFNSHERPSPQRELVKELFEEQVQRSPDAVAVVCGGERMSYAQLNARANRIADRLRAMGVGPGVYVGVMLEKSIDLVPAVLGVVKSGGAYIPLDPNYPSDRLAFMLGDAAPRVLVTYARHAGLVTASDAAVLALDDPDALDGCSEANPPSSASGTDLAYVIYTSGSTGQPKGAMIANRSLASAFYAYERTYRLGELTAHAQMASFSFDVFTGDLIRSLLVGAKLVLCPMEIVLDPPALHALMVREGVDMAEFVPATATLLFEWAAREGKRLDFMRLVVVSSEAWRNERYAFFKELVGPETRLVNSYGLTEATIDSTWFEPGADTELIPGRFVPIGRALANTRAYVLDAQLEPQPVGVAGELCIGGVAVARGYLNRPELTATKFVADPFAGSEDQGGLEPLLYRTGDLARWLPDGTIDFLGRTDRQIKIRGFRIEPGEIESVLERHGGVRAAAVTDRPDPSGQPRLVAYIVAEDPARAPAPDDLRALVAEHLPAYMIPAAWTTVEVLPVTPNGKVDLDALPEPTFDRSAAADEFVAPRTDAERELCAIWCDVLDVDEVGVHDNFFALGGHSLLAVKLFTEIERRMGAKIPLAALFATATVAGLAELIERQRGGEKDAGFNWVVPMTGAAEGRPFFLIGWVDGELLGYKDLAAHWQGPPLFGLVAPGVDGRTLPSATIEAIAAHHIKQMRGYQPEGPYYFGGFCFAGVVAYEIARQLRAQGEEVGMAALIDSYWARRQPPRLQIERQKWSSFKAADRHGKARWIATRMGRLYNRLRGEISFRSRVAAVGLMTMTGRVHSPRGWNPVTVAGRRAALRYSPVASDVRIDFFRAQTGDNDEATQWETLAADGVNLRPVIGPHLTHITILKEPGVRTLAAEMKRALDESLGGAGRNGTSASLGAGAVNGRANPDRGSDTPPHPARAA